MLEHEISELLTYGIREQLLQEEDVIYARNRLLHLLHLEEWDETKASAHGMALHEILERLIHYAIDHKYIEDTQNSRDQFDSMLMDALLPLPSQVLHQFQTHYLTSPRQATDYYYHLSCRSNYIRCDRLKKDVKWTCDTPYGTLDITINMAKPEKDPKDIAKAKTSNGSYPQCALCKDNEGYYGDASHAARQNHRIIPLQLANERYYLQYSPYSYYPQHCIVLHDTHKPMVIDLHTFRKLLSFVTQFPHYFIGSNADLPIVGGSILSHDHYQGGQYHFAMEQAKQLDEIISEQYEGVTYGRLYWPLSVIRARAVHMERLVAFADHVLKIWKHYDDSSLGIYAYSDETPHHTITPIARYKDGVYELDLVLRDNRCSEERPLGIFHPAPKWHHIKKENIGLIEVMGLAVLPSRLKKELDEIEQCLQNNIPLAEHLKVHAPWVAELQARYGNRKQENWHEVLQKEVGAIFMHVLEDAGVFKQDEAGQAGFDRFLKTVKERE